METAEKIEVYLNSNHVGTIAPYQRYLTAFEYAQTWLENGFSISPFSLPLERGVKIAKYDPFDGLFGIFADSLPDGWGRLLVDRMLRKEGERPETITPFMRLSIVGTSGMGALEYRPVYCWKRESEIKEFDRLAEECKKILQSEESNDLDDLFALGGSSGGARPKVMLNLDGEEWIVKFPSSGDPNSIGLMEYEYNLCAKECGIDTPEVRLFPSKHCEGYFGCKRFDRSVVAGTMDKYHMASAAALLEVSHRVPALDYSSLMSLTWQVTRRAEDLKKMFKLMCFNVFSHNRDDHAKNFSFLHTGNEWRLAPAYDLTYSSSIGGEHATSIAGEGKAPGIKEILLVARHAGIKEKEAKQIAEEIRETTNRLLSKYMPA